jgi:DNA modification methylase
MPDHTVAPTPSPQAPQTMTNRCPENPSMEIAWWPTDKAIPYARNARICPESAVAKVAASIQEFGWRQPIVVDQAGVILAGHTRLLAARRLGLKQVPVHVASGLTAAQAKAFRLMDNRSNQETSWDLELLPLELEELLALEIDPALTGFAAEEIAALLATPSEGLCDPDELPEIPEEPISKPGDLYLLGAHRLLCGDATNAVDVRRLMAGERAALMATDPPYLVNYDGGNRPQTWAKDGRAISSEEKTRHWDDYVDYDSSVEFYSDFLKTAIAGALADNPAIYQWHASMRVEVVLQSWRAAGLLAHQQLIWYKSRPVLTRQHYLWDFEPMMYGWIRGHLPDLKPPNNARTVWPVDQRAGTEEGLGAVHPTIKPVELIRRCIEYHTRAGGLLYEPFSGSGTALIAAELTGRRCYALELAPAYVDVAVTRWQRFTGKTAVRAGTDG